MNFDICEISLQNVGIFLKITNNVLIEFVLLYSIFGRLPLYVFGIHLKEEININYESFNHYSNL